MIKIIPQFPEYEDNLTEEKIEQLQLSDEQSGELAKLEAEILLLKQDIGAFLKNLSSAESSGRRILEVIGELQIELTPKGKGYKWAFTLDKKIIEAGVALDEHRSLKILVDASGQSKLGNMIPPDWLNNLTWKQFIDASVSFVKSLTPEEQIEYSSSTCPYCLQELMSEKAKNLVLAYHALEDENKRLLQQCEIKIARISNDLESVIATLKQIPQDVEILKGELPSIGVISAFTFDTDSLQKYLAGCVNAAKQKTNLPVDEGHIRNIGDAGKEIVGMCERFSQQIWELQKGKEDRDKKIGELEKKAGPLRLNKLLVENKELIKTCVVAMAKIDSINTKLTDITSLKQATNTLATKFSKEVPLDIFKTYLKKEYESLNYLPPDIWKITCTTSGLENKRVYSLGDKRVSDIFSEGECKIHALADFLAESAMNNFRGVYIFDDPVNSLDEEKTECFRDRLMRLVEEGNQVIIFTHNLVFLNLLVDTEKQKVTLITRLANQVILEPNVILGTDKELSTRIKVIEERIKALSISSDLQKDEYYLRNVYDLISGYLESYVEIKIFKNVINRYRPNIRMHSLDRLSTFDVKAIGPVMDLYKQTSRKGARHSQPAGSPSPHYDELQAHFKQFSQKFSLNK